MGFNMNMVLAWFITFNFVNITWVFFRAKEWDDAVKILGGMFSLDDVVLPNFLASKLSILSQYGIEFGGFTAHLSAGLDLVVWLLLGLIFVLLFKNAPEKIKTFEINYKTSFFTSILFIYSILSMYKVSEFLYFNF